MTIKLLLRKLRIDNKEFITSEELKEYCRSTKVSYVSAVNYFLAKRYVVRIFRGIFYIRSLDEIKLGRSRYNHLELVSKGLEIKRIRNWYFGLHTALKLNNVTHEHFSIEEVVNDSLLRHRPMNIAGYKFRFVKISSKLLRFGIIEKDHLRYSDHEKTVLDFIYLWRYNGIPSEKIVADISDWSKGVSKRKLRDYAGRYPATVRAIIEMVIK
jgi:predicted transcriptional regulator of viral defense system